MQKRKQARVAPAESEPHMAPQDIRRSGADPARAGVRERPAALPSNLSVQAMPRLDFLTPEAVSPGLRANGKKHLLQELSAQAARLAGLDDRQVFETLLQRERLGSTGIGDGIAIPHAKIPGLQRLVGLVARLDKPVHFEAIDGQPVEIVFLLLAPEGAGADHLKALARIARVLREPGIRERIRAARDASAIYAVLNETSKPRAA
jgi:nitrogen PTS system EIIA component